MSILEDYGLTNPDCTRSLILKLIAQKEKTGVPDLPLNFENISKQLWCHPNIMWENLHTVWRSERHYQANYWKSTDIKQNLETLCDCGLIDGDEKDGYTLTDEGLTAAIALSNSNKTNGEETCKK